MSNKRSISVGSSRANKEQEVKKELPLAILEIMEEIKVQDVVWNDRRERILGIG